MIEWIEDWIATIKVLRNKQLREILDKEGDPSEYVPIKGGNSVALKS